MVKSSVKVQRNWKLMISLALNLSVLFALYNAVISVFIPNQVANIDAQRAASNLAVVMTVEMLFAMFIQPIVGALSDRTRCRFGRRTPWIVGGAVLGAAGLYLMSFQTTIAGLTVFWILAAVSLNAMNGPLVTTIADRFAEEERGVVSGVTGAAQTAAGSLGIVIAGYLAGRLGMGYLAFAAAIAIACILFCLTNPEPSSKDMEMEPFNLKEFIKGFWVNPKEYPDFGWAFFARFLMNIGYQGAVAYQLYILRNYIGLSNAESNHVIGRVSAVMMVGLLISSLCSGWLSDYFKKRKRFVIFAAAIMACALVMPLLIPSVTGMLLYAGFMGLGYGTYIAVDYALLIEVLPNSGENAGKDLGVLTIAQNTPQALCPLIAVALLNLTGQNYASIFVFGVIVVAASALCIVPIKSVK